MVSAKKSLGQNWLKAGLIINDIVKTARIVPGEDVLEIGPGQGVLTAALLAAGARVTAVEKDDRLIPLLAEKFSAWQASGKFMLVHADALAFDPQQHNLTNGGYKIIANIPYYITGQLLRHFLAHQTAPLAMVVLVQKEVAERIVALDGKESLLSLSVKAYGTPSLVRQVGRGNFLPPPQVDSALLAIENISKNFFAEHEEKDFFALLHRAFQQKRKMLRGTLGKDYATALVRAGISPQARPEDLTLTQWKLLLKN